MPLARIESTPDLVDQVHRALVDAISDGSLPGGMRITQEDLAERMSVSRQPVLQAIRLLKEDGLIVDAPGRGVMVAPVDAASLTQIYQVRAALETLAARLAASHGARLDPALIATGRRAARGSDINAMIEADQRFHQAIYEASGNPMIERSARPHWCHVRRAMGAVLRTAQQRQTLWDEHQAIADAIASGDPDEAQLCVQLHAQHAGDSITERLRALLERASAA